jgi:hypothetical protein
VVHPPGRLGEYKGGRLRAPMMNATLFCSYSRIV